jgi:hypothetical protein
MNNTSKNTFDTDTCRNPECGLIVIDNFYKNPDEVRDYVLQQEFGIRGNYPGQRTISYATEEIKNLLQKYVEPFGGKIIEFPISMDDSSKDVIYNGSFQYTTSRDRSWIHIDGYNNWGGVLYLTPNAPLSSEPIFIIYMMVQKTKETWIE